MQNCGEFAGLNHCLQCPKKLFCVPPMQISCFELSDAYGHRHVPVFIQSHAQHEQEPESGPGRGGSRHLPGQPQPDDPGARPHV